jgi:predicted RNA binding protein YcfA (HicA-like mRNA interferase family)
MTRLPTLYAHKIIQALEQAGVVFDRQTGSHSPIILKPLERL